MSIQTQSPTVPIITPSQDRLLKTSEVAARLGLAVRTLKEWRGVSKGPKFVRLDSNLVRYRLSALLDYMSQTHGGNR
jgi:predicted DNA-binding transcriptional regulator AlpA